MGFTADEKTEITSVGITLDTAYYTLRRQCTISGFFNSSGAKRYHVHGRYMIYASRDAYLASAQPIQNNVSVEVELETLTGKEPMTELYAALKTKLGLTAANTTDFLND